MPYTALSSNKLRHVSEVSRLMYEAAIEMHWPEEIAQDMAVLGFVHDIGYVIQKSDHSTIGANMLARSGYAYEGEVRNHGRLIDNPSQAQALLWHADMSVGPNGERMNYDERITDIEHRYGPNSDQARNARNIANWLSRNFPACCSLKEHGGTASSIPTVQKNGD
jgi:HD superfamily phosphodiesterase